VSEQKVRHRDRSPAGHVRHVRPRRKPSLKPASIRSPAILDTSGSSVEHWASWSNLRDASEREALGSLREALGSLHRGRKRYRLSSDRRQVRDELLRLTQPGDCVGAA
jgi:hypothetical protein